MAAACGECDGPCFRATVNLNRAGMWVVGPQVTEFTCTTIHQGGQSRKAATAYSSRMLTPLILQTLKAAPKTKATDLAALLQPFLNLTINPSLLRATTDRAKQQIYGEVDAPPPTLSCSVLGPWSWLSLSLHKHSLARRLRCGRDGDAACVGQGPERPRS